jgi:hypothetical protein
MSAILRSPITWILVTLGIASGVGIAKTRTKRKKKKGSTKKGQERKTARRAYIAKPKKRTTTRKTKSTKKKKSKGKRGKRPSKATFSKMIRNNSRFTKAQKDRMIRNYRG